MSTSSKTSHIRRRWRRSFRLTVVVAAATKQTTATATATTLHVNQTLAVHIDGVGDTSNAVPLFHQREMTCYDRSRHCPEWAELAECRKKNAKLYMKDNCPLSCNLCNPSLEPWFPRESDGRGGLNRMTFESQILKEFQIFTGVPQKSELSRRSFPVDSENHDWEYSKSRFQDVLLSQANYLDEYYRDIQYVKDGTLISASSIDVDDTYIPHGTELPLAETCINRHSYCALWTIQGFCELQPQRMKAICAPMCHFCDTIELNGSKVSVLEDVNYHSSPFHRNDLFGILDAIREDRVVIDWPTDVSRHVPTIKKNLDGTELTLLDTMHIQKSVMTQKRSKESIEHLQSIMHSHEETGISRQQVIVMDNFTTPEFCLAILDTVKFGVGFNLASLDTKNMGDDGFPESTTNYRNILNMNDGETLEYTKLMRNSSRVFLYPTIKHGNASQFAPSLERLIEKVALLVGIPVANVETPLLLEKFTAGQFRKESSHFLNSVMKEWKVDKSPGSSNYTTYQDENIKQEESFSIMKNARIFGFTLFLNDVQEGGSIYFPDFSKLHVEPRIGKALLFPTVVSLNGSWHSQADPRESFLLEDRSTFANHEKVIQGTKYSITIYFTRFEDVKQQRGLQS